LTIRKKITIMGGYDLPFANQISPDRDPVNHTTTIVGVIIVDGVSPAPIVPPEALGIPPLDVRVESLSVTTGGIDIKSEGIIISGLYYPPLTAKLTLESVAVFGVADHFSGISLDGAGNKLSITKSTISNNNGTSNGGGGISASSGTILDVGAGTIFSGNIGANGGAIGASNASTITIGGGVTMTANSATNGGGIYAAGSFLTVGSAPIS